MKLFVAKNYYIQNLKVALPVILSLAGQSVVQMIDTIMVGRLGAQPLAVVSLSCSIITNVMMIGTGIAMALTPLVGVKFVRNNRRGGAILFQNSLSLNILIGLLSCALLLGINPLLAYMNQPKEVLDILDGYYYWTTLSLIPYMVFLTFKQMLEGMGNTLYSMLITIGCNVLNIFLNFGFIFGYMGFPQLGATGAGLSTFIARMVMPLSFFAIVYAKKNYRYYLSLFSLKSMSLNRQWQLLKVGFPIATQMTLELFSLTMITIMMGWLGAKTLAANQIVQTMIGFSFMISNGVASASTILVSHDLGRKNILDIRSHTYAGMHIGVAIMVCFAFIYGFGGAFIASMFSADTEVISIAAGLFIVVAFFEIFDGLQITSLGALRGLAEVKYPMYYAIIAYIFIAIPSAYVMAFVFDLGSQGILAGFMIGLIMAAILFIRRFRKKVHLLDATLSN